MLDHATEYAKNKRKKNSVVVKTTCKLSARTANFTGYSIFILTWPVWEFHNYNYVLFSN